MITVSIDLNKIPADTIFESENGGRYINVVVVPYKDGENQWGKTHAVKLSQSKEDREAQKPVVYVGSGKEYVFENKENLPF